MFAAATAAASTAAAAVRDDAIEKHSEKKLFGAAEVAKVAFIDEALQQVQGHVDGIDAFDATANPVHRLRRDEALVGELRNAYV